MPPFAAQITETRNASPAGQNLVAPTGAAAWTPAGDAPQAAAGRSRLASSEAIQAAPAAARRALVWTAFLTAAAFALLFATLFGALKARAEPISPGAITVIDGDTIAVGQVHYRLVGFDTPETTRRAKCPAERDLGHAAARRLRLIISKGGLDLKDVPCSCRPGTQGTKRCNYGRRCGVLTQAGRDVGERLITEGYARPYPYDWRHPPRHPDWCKGGM